MSDIKLMRFEVEYQRWGKNKDKYECSARFKHGDNNFSIVINEGLGSLLVEVCKGEIAKASAKALEDLVLIAKAEAE